MKNKKTLARKLTQAVAAILALLLFAACKTSRPAPVPPTPIAETGQIYLFGESHANADILDEELRLWGELYAAGLRHLFIESAYYTAEYLNIWMQADDDALLDKVFASWQGTAAGSQVVYDFYKQIKIDCPETIFHGTDIGHQYETLGAEYLAYLSGAGLEDTAQFALTQEAIEQGSTYYATADFDNDFREYMMAENFIREYDALGGESIMGIYGSAHTGLDASAYHDKDVPSMGNQLYEHYGDIITSVDLSSIGGDMLRVDLWTINGVEYDCSYFGEEDMTAWSGLFTLRKFWRIENAYEDFRDKPKTGDYLPYDNYPMELEVGQVFMIELTHLDGTVMYTFYRSDGAVWEGRDTTEEFTPNEP